MITKEGYTLLVYFQEVPQTIKIGADTYRFSVKANVCGCWVKDAHVGAVLGISKTCCGGNKRYPYRIANDMQKERWGG